MMAIPFIAINRFEPGFLERWEEKVQTLSRQAQFIGGAPVQQLEQRLSRYTGAECVVTCANGSDALGVCCRNR